ncbi:MAG: hypothetical protein ACKVP2_02350 [Burkholderiales bacterium]
MVPLVGLCAASITALAESPGDLLFKCVLGEQIRTLIYESGRSILWDAGKPFQATLTPETIDAVYTHDWSAGSRMRHRLVIGRKDRTFRLEVDEISTEGELRQSFNRDAGTCSPEKKQSRLLKNPSAPSGN